MIARIAVSGVPYRLDRPYDYNIPVELAASVLPEYEWRYRSRTPTGGRKAWSWR